MHSNERWCFDLHLPRFGLLSPAAAVPFPEFRSYSSTSAGSKPLQAPCGWGLSLSSEVGAEAPHHLAMDLFASATSCPSLLFTKPVRMFMPFLFSTLAIPFPFFPPSSFFSSFLFLLSLSPFLLQHRSQMLPPL